ncbi:unnamed protein product, partial [Heterosigma akashiwo]
RAAWSTWPSWTGWCPCCSGGRAAGPRPRTTSSPPPGPVGPSTKLAPRPSPSPPGAVVRSPSPGPQLGLCAARPLWVPVFWAAGDYASVDWLGVSVSLELGHPLCFSFDCVHTCFQCFERKSFDVNCVYTTQR